MKILRPGNPDGWSKKVKCTGKGNGGGGCGANLLQMGDVFHTQAEDRTGYTVGPLCATFQCPQCGKRTDIRRWSVPDNAYGPEPKYPWETK